MNQENQVIKVTKCSDCPMCITISSYGGIAYLCESGAFEDFGIPPNTIHPNCLLKGQTITYKIGKNE